VCFDVDSSPPVTAISGAAVSHDELVLESRDGNRFAAFAAEPEEPSGAGVVVLPDVRGLYRFYEELALRFAERGTMALAIDYFGRTAGVAKRGDDFEYRPHVEQTTPESIQADVAAAVRWARGADTARFYRVDPRRVALVGHSMGGWLALLGTAADPSITCAAALEFADMAQEGADTSFATYTRWLTAPGAPLRGQTPAVQHPLAGAARGAAVDDASP
jgi:carboxymethylenebutenolidase